MDKYAEIRVPIAHNNPSIKRKENKCVLCGKCKDVCKKQVGVAGYWQYDSNDIVCINCGQCANFCPVQAIVEQDETNKLMTAINNPQKKVAVMVAPAVRVSLGEMFGIPAGKIVAGKVVSALKNLGVDYVFDVAFGADLTVMEEATELLNRKKHNSDLPQFTSCCPAWVSFVKTFYPDLVPNLSTCKSPIAMQSSVIKNIFAKQAGIKPADLVVVAAVPCVAKKAEAKLLCLNGEYGRETDVVVSVRELANLIKSQNIDFANLNNSEFDKPFSLGTGSGVMFGASGGVMQATVRTAYYLKTNQNPPADLIQLKPMRGYAGVKTATVQLGDETLNLCAIYGTANARKVLDKLNKFNFDFVEVMACPNGCVGGGGQPRQEDNVKATQHRASGLFGYDNKAELKCSYQNPQVQAVYKKYLGKPNSKKAQVLLHVNHMAR